MQESAQAASNLLDAMSNENRLMILCQLSDGEKSVGQLAELIGARQVAVSQQLAILRREGLVRPRRQAQTVFYSLASDAARQVIETLYAIYCGPAADKAEKPAA
ncbi:MAG: metalloregulator ArsR/SmtB family transcription factor [Alphaproteobacteria bacterium]|nr:metalloregulator ArsR/SmtB family transcription factor [Alphaproteobacteria bacterium]MDP6563420.1 metalloregulator ArsR/SmtB family transcription factor [Alphaproteobacteria bacterium]MDP6812871.1 metalloregulator ArsR/SmtB family transcription factor [Alphaproteobacteria bacterium]